MNTVLTGSSFDVRARSAGLDRASGPASQPVPAQGHMALVQTPRFQGSHQASQTTPLPAVRSWVKSLWGSSGKNLGWGLGYGISGVLLIPTAVPFLVPGAFCLAGVHLASAAYQFLSHAETTADAKPGDAKKRPQFAGQSSRHHTSHSLSFLA